MADFNDFGNEQVAQLPKYLRQFVVDQHYEHYTPLDHAIWRYVMRQNYTFLKDVAYYPYIPGLRKAGLTIEKIPSLQEMNNALGKIGWGAVTVDGFIPPAAFMEFQAYHVLVIAADIRQLHHIQYTPTPDIIHESAGHAPIIAEPDYNSYLSYIGSIGAKAIYSSKDFELYDSIRELSILKEMPNAIPEQIKKAEEKVEYLQKNLGKPSEMALLSRLHWWTVEYGLIGSLETPKIYGAGLLSSIAESANCMSAEVKKLRYTVDAVNYPFDITKPQPQLFVTDTFQNLTDVLEEFANTMAFRKGGSEGLNKAIECSRACTAVYSSGLQVSGLITEVITNFMNEPVLIKTSGPTSLCHNGQQLEGHDKEYHKDGFSSPVGRLKDHKKALENFSSGELQLAGIEKGKQASLNFESGIRISGKIKELTIKEGMLLLICFTDCTVKDEEGKVYFEASWGDYDMAVGERIVSVFCGVADKDAYEDIPLKSKAQSFHPAYDDATENYHQLFQIIRSCRETQSDYFRLIEVWETIKKDFKDDWLGAMEILEIIVQADISPEMANEIFEYLIKKTEQEPEYSKLIRDGLRIINNPVKDLMDY